MWQLASAPHAHVLPEPPSPAGRAASGRSAAGGGDPAHSAARAPVPHAPGAAKVEPATPSVVPTSPTQASAAQAAHDEVADVPVSPQAAAGTATASSHDVSHDLAAVTTLLSGGAGAGPGHLDADALAERAVAILAARLGVPHVRIFVEAGTHRGPVMAATDNVASMVGQVESIASGGPSEKALAGTAALSDDLQHERRWGTLPRRLVDAFGVHSLAVVPVPVAGRAAGVLAAYGAEVGQATHAVDRLNHFAAVVGAALGSALREGGARTEVSQLREAMASRAVIEQAKGVLLAQRGIDADAAFEVLRRESMVRNRRLRDVATELVEHARQAAP